jgi:hypothetical protein
MTWRQKLLHTNLYDLLCRMQENGNDCVIAQITGKPQYERCEKHESGWAITQCRKCIAEYLNEEAK